jgi:MYXO-CTERM domain-containing protein
VSGIYDISQFEVRFNQRMIPDGEVPSPGTLILLVFGLLALVGGRRRRVV